MVLSDIDRQLLNRCLAQEQGAWEEFLDRYLPLIVHVVNNTARLRFDKLPDQWRDDLVAEVLLAIVENQFAVLHRFSGQSSLGTYLVVIARRVAARKIAKMRRLNFGSSATFPDLVSSGQNQSSEQEQFEQQEQVDQLLSELPETEAQVVRMYHLEHLSYAEISSHLGIPENSIGPMLSRARGRMRSSNNADQASESA